MTSSEALLDELTVFFEHVFETDNAYMAQSRARRVRDALLSLQRPERAIFVNSKSEMTRFLTQWNQRHP